MHADTTIEACQLLYFHEHNTTSKSFRSVSSVVSIPYSGSTSIVVLGVRILVSVVVPPMATLYVCSRSWLQLRCTSCEPNWTVRVFFFLFSFSSSPAGFRYDKERCTCEKDILNLSFPVPKAGGAGFKTVHLTLIFFLLVSFVLSLLLTTRSDKIPTSVSWPCSSPTFVAQWSSDTNNLPAYIASTCQLQLPNGSCRRGGKPTDVPTSTTSWWRCVW